ncbi:hypothetical protein QCA50_011234 [Cerrena zonata]|uniref:C2H2-type domain-containing protein n=1 Tax=Cerrena zonata TaxID=2478898 RepID=A0AAW0FZ26_9APHY
MSTVSSLYKRRYCSKLLETANLQKSHERVCKPADTITISNTVITLTRNQNQKYQCQCDSIQCNTEYATVAALKKHLKKHKGTWISNNPTSSSLSEESEEIPLIRSNIPVSVEISDDEEEEEEEEREEEYEEEDSKEDHDPDVAVIQERLERLQQLDQDPTSRPHSSHSSEKSSSNARSSPSLEYEDPPLPGTVRPVISSISYKDDSSDSEDLEATFDFSDIYQHPDLDTFNLIINTSLGCLCCELCHIALTTTQTIKHMRQQHPKLPAYPTLPFLCALSNIYCYDSFAEFSDHNLNAFGGLSIYIGVECPACDYKCRSKESMRVHHRTDHPEHPATTNWSSCHLQQLNHSSHKQFFKVILPQSTSNPQINIAKMFITQARQQVKTVYAKLEAETSDARLITPWLLSTKWHIFTAGCDTEALCAMVAFPIPSEYPGLAHIVKAYCQSALQLIDSTDTLTLQKLHTPDPDKTGIVNEPFHKLQQDSTISQYQREIVILVAMLLRSDTAYPLHLNEDTKNAVDTFQTALTREGAEINKQLNATGSVDTTSIENLLHQLLVQCWMNRWTPTATNTTPCPTFTCIMLCNLIKDGRFQEAKLIKKRARDQNIRDLLACNQVEPWFIEKEDTTPFNMIRSLQHRASAISYSTPNVTNIWWTDRVNFQSLVWSGNEIHLSQITSMFHNMETEMMNIWSNDLLLNTDAKVDITGHISDDLDDHSVGYSFLTDRRNTMFRKQDQLLKAILANPAAKAKIVVATTSGYAWRRDGLFKWLQDYAILQGLIFLRVEMLGGAPGRGSELFSMMYCNIMTRIRNLFIIGTYICVLRNYHKSGANSGVDKLIPHALDAFTGNLLIQSLALARPMAEIFAEILFPDNTEVSKLYQSRLFVKINRAFTTDDLSNLMAEKSQASLGFRLTVNPWRHINIAWRRQLCAACNVIS